MLFRKTKKRLDELEDRARRLKNRRDILLGPKPMETTAGTARTFKRSSDIKGPHVGQGAIGVSGKSA